MSCAYCDKDLVAKFPLSPKMIDDPAEQPFGGAVLSGYNL